MVLHNNLSIKLDILFLGQIKIKCVSGNGSELFRQGRHTYFFLIIFL